MKRSEHARFSEDVGQVCGGEAGLGSSWEHKSVSRGQGISRAGVQ